MDTLALDVGYQPVALVNWRQSIVWVLDHVAEVVEEHGDRYINTVNWSVKVPSVVRFLKPIARRKAVKFSRQSVFARDRGRCQYCGSKVKRDDFTYDHVVPRAQGGRTCWENVVCACSACNQRKAGRTPEQARMRLLSVPVKPRKLPDAPRSITYHASMPSAWRDYLRDACYWEGELENENSGG